MPCKEIGWRLDKRYWNKGLATEAAKTALEFVTKDLGIEEIYSYTSHLNLPSENVMKKIGLRSRPDLTFDHPRIELGNSHRRHIVYSL